MNISEWESMFSNELRHHLDFNLDDLVRLISSCLENDLHRCFVSILMVPFLSVAAMKDYRYSSKYSRCIVDSLHCPQRSACVKAFVNQVIECAVNEETFFKTLGFTDYSSRRWLPRGNVLSRTFEMRLDILVYSKEDPTCQIFYDADFSTTPVQSCDIFEQLNFSLLEPHALFCNVLI